MIARPRRERGACFANVKSFNSNVLAKAAETTRVPRSSNNKLQESKVFKRNNLTTTRQQRSRMKNNSSTQGVALRALEMKETGSAARAIRI
jgi:hypothetical protein